MSAHWFGTDGMRGVFGEPPLDEPTVVRLGQVLGSWLAERGPQPLVVIAGDTRDSVPALAHWLAQGLAAAGSDVHFAGVLPTPAVAILVRDLGAAAGVAVSASHNPWPDNGIKLVGADGFKWSTADERELERRLRAGASLPAPASLPPLAIDTALHARYLHDLLAAYGAAGASQSRPSDTRPLAGQRVLLDAANGAASVLAGEVFSALGSDVRVLNATPDGRNINLGCGSLHPEGLAREVVAAGAALGFAFDGDADRAILVDEHGEVRDGDAMLYLWARDLAGRDALPGRRIVATTMSNLGLERALASDGIGVERCAVGDRAVVETLRASGLVLGGEQSGHIVHLPSSTTGDGLLTATTLAVLVARSGRPVSELLAGFERFPQLLRNVRVARKPPLESLPAVVAARESVEDSLGAEGRVVLRYSGTEPLARIMIEGPDSGSIERHADTIEQALVAALGE